MGHEPQLVPDITLLVQLGIFFATYFVLKTLVFKPYLELLNERKARTTGLKEQADRDRQQAEKLEVDYDTFIKAERKKVTAWTDDERKKISDEERGIVQAARDAVGKELEDLRVKIQTDTERARKELLPLVTEYSSQIASKLVGHKISVPAGTELSSKTKAEENNTVLH
jgi:F0F1-type ATP synthase membrane subunit b/b'